MTHFVLLTNMDISCYGELLEAFQVAFAFGEKERRHQNINLINVHNKTQLPKHSSR